MGRGLLVKVADLVTGMEKAPAGMPGMGLAENRVVKGGSAE